MPFLCRVPGQGIQPNASRSAGHQHSSASMPTIAQYPAWLRSAKYDQSSIRSYLSIVAHGPRIQENRHEGGSVYMPHYKPITLRHMIQTRTPFCRTDRPCLSMQNFGSAAKMCLKSALSSCAARAKRGSSGMAGFRGRPERVLRTEPDAFAAVCDASVRVAAVRVGRFQKRSPVGKGIPLRPGATRR